jgi:hypothetical protein
VGITQTPYWNLMLNREILRIKKRPTWHRSFLPQEVVRREVWIGGLQKKHSYKWQSPQRKCSWIFTQMNGWSIFLNRNLWLRVALEIEIEQGLI